MQFVACAVLPTQNKIFLLQDIEVVSTFCNTKICCALSGNTVEALINDHLGNSEKWSQLELVSYESGLS